MASKTTRATEATVCEPGIQVSGNTMKIKGADGKQKLDGNDKTVILNNVALPD